MTTSNYLTKALVMYDSLIEQCCDNFTLYYFAFDKLTFNYLSNLNLPNLVPIQLVDLEKFYPDLVELKNSRSNAEYFFTCTPHIIDYVLKNNELDHVIYLDADLYFYNDPRIILEEMETDSVLITEHWRYNPSKEDLVSGNFCVQFIPFKKDDCAQMVIDWWKSKCIEWCFLKAENGKWADQGYLDQWPELFEKIRIMDNRGGGVARWNLHDYDFYFSEFGLRAFNKVINVDVDIVFYHYEGLKIYSNGLLNSGIWKKDKNVHNCLYKEYIRKLSLKEREILKILGIKRSDLLFNAYHQNMTRFLIGELRRLFFPKSNDRRFYFKYLNKYRWLP